MKKRNKKAFKKRIGHLKQYRELLLTDRVILAAILKHINHLNDIAHKMEMNDSSMIGIGLYKTYAFEIEDTANDIRTLLLQLYDTNK